MAAQTHREVRGHIHWIHPSCRRPAPLTCEQAAAERQLSWASTYRSLAVCFRLQRNHKWYTINSCHQQHSGSHGWQHHQALLQWRHLPDHYGGAGGHVQAHPYWNLTGDQQVTRTRGGGLEVYTAIMDSKWIVKKKKVSWEELEKPWGGVLIDLRSFVPPEMLSHRMPLVLLPHAMRAEVFLRCLLFFF